MRKPADQRAMGQDRLQSVFLLQDNSCLGPIIEKNCPDDQG